MSEKRMYIITDGSKEIGWGHITRCISFYDKFAEHGFVVEMLVDGEKACLELLGKRNYKFIGWHNDIKQLDFVRDHVIFLDSLVATQMQTDYLEKIALNFIVIDDYRRRSYRQATIIDWTPNVENTGKHSHNKIGNNHLLLGLEYSVLRTPFTWPFEYEICNLCSLTIVMGGSDVRNLTFPLVSSIYTSFPDLNINVVLSQETKDFLFFIDRVTCYRALSAEQMRNLFLSSDLVISAGGQTLFELAALRIPVIPIQVVDNQTEDLAGLQTLGFFDEVFLWDDPYLLENIQNKIRKLKDKEIRKKYVENFQMREIGRGINKIFDYIQKNLL